MKMDESKQCNKESVGEIKENDILVIINKAVAEQKQQFIDIIADCTTLSNDAESIAMDYGSDKSISITKKSAPLLVELKNQADDLVQTLNVTKQSVEENSNFNVDQMAKKIVDVEKIVETTDEFIALFNRVYLRLKVSKKGFMLNDDRGSTSETSDNTFSIDESQIKRDNVVTSSPI